MATPIHTTQQGQVAPESHPGDKYDIPSYEAPDSLSALKDRIKKHYEIASDYYYSLWGQHIHHGYFKSPTETKEQAQVNLIDYLLEISALPDGSRVLDVGCGVGGTTRFLAKEHDCQVTGITISGRQVEIAKRLTLAETSTEGEDSSGFFAYSKGKARFIELDAEKMAEYFAAQAAPSAQVDCVWISEALSHLPNKPLFFSSSFSLVASGGRLVIADWFKAPGLTTEQVDADIKPIEDGMLLPRLFTSDEYVAMAKEAGFKLRGEPIDISKDVAKTWDISWSLVSSPSLWAFAISQGRDGLAFLQAFRAMRRGYANGTFRYAIMSFEKP
ncbi:S-adenosyl-L-methionine-dependent methyltransferase [Xylariaceae sp. FL0016]|nr:S-adenosyl-L-methionine-dependent methyltransferase [Xylariaceae sp. FL0016]